MLNLNKERLPKVGKSPDHFEITVNPFLTLIIFHLVRYLMNSACPSRKLSTIERFLHYRTAGGGYKGVSSFLRLKLSGMADFRENLTAAMLLVVYRTVNLRSTVVRNSSTEIVVIPCDKFGFTSEASRNLLSYCVGASKDMMQSPLRTLIKFVPCDFPLDWWNWNSNGPFASDQPDYVNVPVSLKGLENGNEMDVEVTKVLEACTEHSFSVASTVEMATSGLDYCLWNLICLENKDMVDLIFHYDHCIADGRSGMLIWQKVLEALQQVLDFKLGNIQGGPEVLITEPHTSLDVGLGKLLTLSPSRLLKDAWMEVLLPKSLRRKWYHPKYWVGPESITMEKQELCAKPLEQVDKHSTRLFLVDFPLTINGTLMVDKLRKVAKSHQTTLHGIFLAAGCIAMAKMAKKVGMGYLKNRSTIDKKHLIGETTSNMITLETQSPTCLRPFTNTGKKPSGVKIPEDYMGVYVSEVHASVCFSMDLMDKDLFWEIAQSMSRQVHDELQHGDAFELLASTKFISGDWAKFISNMRYSYPKGQSGSFGISNVKSWTFPKISDPISSTSIEPTCTGFTQTAGVPGLGIDITTMNGRITAIVNSRPGVYDGEGYGGVDQEWKSIEQWVIDWKIAVMSCLEGENW